MANKRGVKYAEFFFPYPPTVNHCWGRAGKAVFLSAKYKAFLNDVALVVAGTRLRQGDEYFLELSVTPPDRRKRDLDNVFKPILDALTRCCVWQDDSAVRFLTARRNAPSKTNAGVKVLVGVVDAAKRRELATLEKIAMARLHDVIELAARPLDAFALQEELRKLIDGWGVTIDLDEDGGWRQSISYELEEDY